MEQKKRGGEGRERRKAKLSFGTVEIQNQTGEAPPDTGKNKIETARNLEQIRERKMLARASTQKG